MKPRITFILCSVLSVAVSVRCFVTQDFIQAAVADEIQMETYDDYSDSVDYGTSECSIDSLPTMPRAACLEWVIHPGVCQRSFVWTNGPNNTTVKQFYQFCSPILNAIPTPTRGCQLGTSDDVSAEFGQLQRLFPDELQCPDQASVGRQCMAIRLKSFIDNNDNEGFSCDGENRCVSGC